MSQPTKSRLSRLATAFVSPFRSCRALRPRRAHRGCRPFHSSAVEQLESRWVFAAPTLGELSNVTLGAGAPLHIALDGADADGDALVYEISLSNNTVTGFEHELRQGDLMEINVSHTASSQPGDTSFTGTMRLKLFEDLAPRTTARFIELAEDGFFDDVIFHRILNNFVIQGGDPTGTGSGGSDLGDFDDEFHTDLLHTQTGLLSMAKSTDDSNNSQFFITEGPQRHLDFNHSVFGMLVEGENVRDQISNVLVQPQSGGRPFSPVTMTSVNIVPDTQNGVLTIKAPTGATGSVTVTVTARDPSGETVQRSFVVTVEADGDFESAPFLNDEANPDVIELNHNQAGTFQLQAIDIDAGPMTFMDRAALQQFQTNENIRLPQQNPNLQVAVNPTTGQLTVTPTGGISGVFQIIVGVGNSSGGVDTQILPVFVDPPAPSAPDLQPEFDTGSSPTDNVTRLDNSNQAGRLNFVVGGVTAGAQVQLFDGQTLIGQGTVPAGATSITITTNGTVDLIDGQHSITAVQTLVDQDVEVGNVSDEVDIASAASVPLALTVDTVAPTISSTAPLTAAVGMQYTYNVEATGEGTTGFTYSFVVSPSGATINPTTGVITWLPIAAQVGNQNFTVRASDQAGNSVEQQFTVDVDPSTGQAPVVNAGTDRTVNVGELLTFTVTATDADSPQSSLRFSLATGAPAGATINETTGVFTWTPNAGQVGANSITVQVTDGTLTGQDTFQVTVVQPTSAFQVVAGDLVISGTGGADTVTIRGTNVAGRFDITGSLGTETVNGVLRGIRVDLLAGDDRVVLNNVFTAGPIAINTGDGNDSVRMGDEARVSSRENFSILLGAGNDQLQMRRIYVAGDITVDGEAGSDSIMVNGSTENSQFVLGASSAGATTLRGGDGDDSILARFSFIVGPWKVEGGAGNDKIGLHTSATSGDTTVSGGDGNDMLLVDTNYFVTSLTVNGNGGSDSLALRSSIMLQSATLLGGDGNDNLEVASINSRGLMISHGAGQDSAAVRASLLQNLFADLGDGDDMLVLQSNQIFGSAEADGGLGLNDQLVDQGNLMRPARKRRFESFG
jgi:cyclophilin family peptidyl-prolyl cis-trans isomerase